MNGFIILTLFLVFLLLLWANNHPDINALISRIKTLEDKQKPSISDSKKAIVQYSLRQLNDFDKYKAIDFVEQLKNVATQRKDKKQTIILQFIQH